MTTSGRSAPIPDLDARVLREAAALVFVEDLERPATDDADSHHLLDVLRLRDGDLVVAADGVGGWRRCHLKRQSPHSARSRTVAGLDPVGDVHRVVPEWTCAVGLAMAKGDRADWAVQKLTELGVDEIRPFVAHRSVVRLDGEDARKRGDRYRRIAREAAAQSRRPRLPTVHDPVPFALALDALSPLGAVALAEPGGAIPLPGLRAILVGPEGGWTSGELAAGYPTVSLGSGVLRAETAAVVAAGLLCGERDGVLRLGTGPDEDEELAHGMHRDASKTTRSPRSVAYAVSSPSEPGRDIRTGCERPE